VLGFLKKTMKDGTEYDIMPCPADRWDDAAELAFRVFMKYEAADYGQKGIDSFAEFLTSPSLVKLFKAGKYIVYTAMIGEDIIGMVSFRSGNFLSLLFVDEKYHRQGIAKELIGVIQDDLLREGKYQTLRVHSSPYGERFYTHMGFKATDEQICGSDGIIYIPMEMYI